MGSEDERVARRPELLIGAGGRDLNAVASKPVTTPAAIARALAGWESGRDGPLPDRLAAALQRGLLEGRIPLEARIPSERELARALRTSRATVSTAYAELRADGWLTTRRGAGSFARLPRELREGMAPRDARTPAGAIDLRRAAPAAPVGAFHAAVAEATAAITPQLTSAGWSQGLPELRAGIAERHARRGVPTAPEEVLVTGGALPGLWLVLSGLLGGAPRVLVETPTYPSALDALRERRARVWGWPVVDGWDPAQFEQLVRQHAIAAAYLMPDFHNPTGRLMDAGTRVALLAVAARHGVTLIVDETMAELDLRPGSPEPPPPLAGPQVITLGSLTRPCGTACRSAGSAPAGARSSSWRGIRSQRSSTRRRSNRRSGPHCCPSSTRSCARDGRSSAPDEPISWPRSSGSEASMSTTLRPAA